MHDISPLLRSEHTPPMRGDQDAIYDLLFNRSPPTARRP